MTSPKDWIREHRIAAFFLLTYAITWTIDLAVLASGMEPSWTRWIFAGFLSALGPVFAAAIVLRASGDSLREWALQAVRWRVHPKWYVAALGIPATIALGSGVVGAYFGSPVDFGNFSPDLITLGIGVVLATLLGGGQEELGWRGFAQPELQARYGALRAAVVIGVLWGGWHLPCSSTRPPRTPSGRSPPRPPTSSASPASRCCWPGSTTAPAGACCSRC
ncbi:CPBP family intramembrane glutamic endopeptidase [Halobacteriaceae archaeon GCM10025711]